MSLRFTLHDSSKKKSDWAVKPVWFGSSPSCEKELPRRSRVFTKHATSCINKIERKGCHDQSKKVQKASFLGRIMHLKLIWFLETELGPPLFEAFIANSMLVCVTLMCFYIGTAQLKKVHGWA